MRFWRRMPAVARLGAFALIPAAGAAGAMALPVLMAAAGALSFRPAIFKQALEKRQLAIVLALAFTAWAALSSLWSAYPNHMQAVRLLATVLLGLSFALAASRQDQRTLTSAAGAAAFVVLALLLAVEALWDMPLNRAFGGGAPAWIIERNPARGATILFCLAWPVAARLAGAAGAGLRATGLLVLVIAAMLETQFHDLGNLAAFIAGMLALAAAFVAPALALRTVSAALAFWILASPVLTPMLTSNQRLIDLLPFSWAARAGIWRYVCAHIAERPWFGHGLDASRAVTDTIVVRGAVQRAVPLHPHSASLQIWFETGAVGALLAASAIAIGGWALARSLSGNKPKAAAACAALAAIGVSANVSYGLWQEWWDAAILLAATLIAALPRTPRAGP